jgi:hypothetical protein
MDILNNIYLFLFVLSTLNIIRNTFFLIRNVRTEERFIMEKLPLLVLGISISYFITTIITVLINL